MKAKIIKESINEGFATEEGRQLEKICRWLGYDDFEEFIGDNPGCYQAIIEWISVYHGDRLVDEHINPEELEKVGLYNEADDTKKKFNESFDQDEDMLKDVHEFGMYLVNALKNIGLEDAELTGLGRKRGNPRVAIEFGNDEYEFYLDKNEMVILKNSEGYDPSEGNRVLKVRKENLGPYDQDIESLGAKIQKIL